MPLGRSQPPTSSRRVRYIAFETAMTPELIVARYRRLDGAYEDARSRVLGMLEAQERLRAKWWGREECPHGVRWRRAEPD